VAYIVIWRYRVQPQHVPAFEAAYGPSGDWARLFARYAGYLGIELVRERQTPGVYLTIDRWHSAASYDAMLRDSIDDYSRLNDDCAALTLTEEKLGAFDLIEAVSPSIRPS
jgi:quinol monooxygenase YgiN